MSAVSATNIKYVYNDVCGFANLLLNVFSCLCACMCMIMCVSVFQSMWVCEYVYELICIGVWAFCFYAHLFENKYL